MHSLKCWLCKGDSDKALQKHIVDGRTKHKEKYNEGMIRCYNTGTAGCYEQLSRCDTGLDLEELISVQECLISFADLEAGAKPHHLYFSQCPFHGRCQINKLYMGWISERNPNLKLLIKEKIHSGFRNIIKLCSDKWEKLLQVLKYVLVKQWNDFKH